MKPKAKAPRWRFVLALLCRVALAVWVWVIALHIKVHPAIAGLDHSGAFTFNYAHVRGMVFGRDIAFTYGPLSYLTLPVPIGHNLEQGFLFQLAVWAIFCGVTGWFVFGRNRPLPAVLLFALGLFLGCDAFRVFGYAGPDMFLAYLGLLLLGGALTGRRWMLWYAGAAALCTLVFFVKFSNAATLGGAMAIFTAALFLSDPPKARRAVLILGAVPVAILVVHVVCYGSPAWLWRYIRVAMEMSSGYGVTVGEGSDTSGLITAIAIMLGWLLATAVLYWRRVASWPLALACLGPLFLEFKHSFARESGHIEIFFMFVPLLFGLVALFTEIRRQDLWYVAAAAFVPAAIWYPRESMHVRALAHPWTPFENRRFLRDAMHLADLRRSLEQFSQQGMAEDRLPPELLTRVGRAPIAVFPMECSYAGANDIEMRPFPIFQAYQAYTPYLDQWNATFLEDPQTAPQFILFDWDTVDGRHPLLDVPATAVSMFRHYELDGVYGRHLLLRKRTASRFGALRQVEKRQARLAEPVRLPAGDHPRAVRIHLAWNFTGRVLKFLFRVPEVRLVASTSDGRSLNVRVPPETMEDGIPDFLPFDMEAARTLYGGTSPGRIETLLIGGEGARYLQSTAEVEIEEAPDLVLPAGPPPLPALSSLKNLGTLDTWRIEMLNDTEAGAFAQVTVPDTRGYVRIQGWAVVDGGVAGGVMIELDGKPYPADYGRLRPEIGALFHAAGPLACGFEWSVPAWDLGKTWHELAVKILARDRSGYYDGGRKLRFKME